MAKRSKRAARTSRRSPRRPSPQSPTRPDSNVVLADLGLIALNLLVYGSVAHHEFVTWDDPQYILNNVHVTGGLNWENISWALTTGYASNRHPLTWWSHMLDVRAYGLSPGAH